MKKYGKVYTYENPKLGKLNMLVIGQLDQRNNLCTQQKNFFGALKLLEFEDDYSKADHLSANCLTIIKNMNTKDQLRKQIEYMRKVLENPYWNMSDENQYMAEVQFYNTNNPDIARLRSLSTNSNFQYKQGIKGSGNGLGLDAIQGATKEVTSQGYKYLQGNSTLGAIPFYNAIGIQTKRIETETKDSWRRTHGKFITPVTHPKLIAPNKFELDPKFTDWATEIVNDK